MEAQSGPTFIPPDLTDQEGDDDGGGREQQPNDDDNLNRPRLGERLKSRFMFSQLNRIPPVTQQQAPEPQPRTQKPQKVLETIYGVGQFKAELPLKYLMLQSFLAGIYKSVGCHTFVTIGGGVLGAVFFPVGLIAIVLTGAELFTGDLLILVQCYLSGKVPGKSLVRNLCVSWVMNFCGTLLWAGLIGYASGAVEDKGQVDFAIDLAYDKVSQPWGHILAKAIGANFLVCLALWQAMTADDVASKILAIWFPIVPFVINGLEHVVANMFFILLGMMFGADISVGEMLWWNLIPATIGNIIGGAFGIALSFWYLFQPTSEQTRLESQMHDALYMSPEYKKQFKQHMRNVLPKTKRKFAKMMSGDHSEDDDSSNSVDPNKDINEDGDKYDDDFDVDQRQIKQIKQKIQAKKTVEVVTVGEEQRSVEEEG